MQVGQVLRRWPVLEQDGNPFFCLSESFAALFSQVLKDTVVVDNGDLPSTYSSEVLYVIDAKLGKDGGVAEVFIVPVEP